MSDQAKTVLAVVVVFAIAGAFWLLLLAPKREKADELSQQISGLSAEVASEQQQAASSLAAKRGFPQDYAQLVQLGKAVPADASTASLLVQLNGLSRDVDTSFQSIQMGTAGGGEASAEAAESPGSLPPLGSTGGPSGFLAMPYSLEFEGGFFDIARFIRNLDSQVETKDDGVEAKGRLVMIDSFELVSASAKDGEASGGALIANFGVSTYVTPPGQGLTAGATPAGPEATPDLP